MKRYFKKYRYKILNLKLNNFPLIYARYTLEEATLEIGACMQKKIAKF